MTAPSSYIPTEDSPVTRAADNVSRVLGGEYNPRGSTFYYEGEITGGVLLQLRTSIPGPGARLDIYSNHVRPIIDGSAVGSIPITNSIEGSNKLAVTYREDGYIEVAVNGISEGFIQDASYYSGLFEIINKIEIGHRSFGTDFYLNGSVENVFYIPISLTSAELEELTS